MKENENTSISTGINFNGILFLVLLVLKLTKYITWSWWWVTAPLWIPLVIIIVFSILWWFMLPSD